jgi:2,3-bisphosphoglycerate-independent phosphoglycerate mutase
MFQWKPDASSTSSLFSTENEKKKKKKSEFVSYLQNVFRQILSIQAPSSSRDIACVDIHPEGEKKSKQKKNKKQM